MSKVNSQRNVWKSEMLILQENRVNYTDQPRTKEFIKKTEILAESFVVHRILHIVTCTWVIINKIYCGITSNDCQWTSWFSLVSHIQFPFQFEIYLVYKNGMSIPFNCFPFYVHCTLKLFLIKCNHWIHGYYIW